MCPEVNANGIRDDTTRITKCPNGTRHFVKYEVACPPMLSANVNCFILDNGRLYVMLSFCFSNRMAN